ncbi:MAG TPA: MmcQ/YjbR family DNA-binding protein [Bacteroidia bacterium]|jgi:predicted DNA-binding protein (MmcQ/YjbR family)|nr:MmcQ/YjbR family DNA-binding protein [Bacteroidia bacterium]
MNIEDLRNYCVKKKGVEETFPFDSDTLVVKVMGKAFLLTGLAARPLSFNVKCDPEKAIELRESYNCVLPGYHMNKKHWNTITPDGSVTDKLIYGWIDDSYELVVAGLPKRMKEKLAKK